MSEMCSMLCHAADPLFLILIGCWNRLWFFFFLSLFLVSGVCGDSLDGMRGRG